MNNFLRIIVLLCSYNFVFASPIFEFELPKTYKVEYTYTAEFDKGTLHLVVAKHKKQLKSYVVLPFKVVNGEVEKWERVPYSNKPVVLSHHSGEASEVIVTYSSSKKAISTLHFNKENGSVQKETMEGIKPLDHVFRLPDMTVLVRRMKNGNGLDVYEVNKLGKVEHFKWEVPEKHLTAFRQLSVDAPDEINQNEYVETGSLMKRKVYFEDHKLIYVFDDLEKKRFKYMRVSYQKSGDLDFKSFPMVSLDNLNDANSYYYKGGVYWTLANKNELLIGGVNLISNKILQNISLKNNLRHVYPSPQALLKSLKKGYMVPSFTLNATTDGNVIVRISSENKALYNYNYNWWWDHFLFQQQMQQFQQFNTPAVPRSFGPNSNEVIAFSDWPYEEDIAELSFVVDRELNLKEQANATTLFPSFNKRDYLIPLEKKKGVSNLSAGFTNTTFNYIAYQKKSHRIIINGEVLKTQQ